MAVNWRSYGLGQTFAQPTAAQAATLAQVRANESSNNYTATISQAKCNAMGYTVCTASGAYGIIDTTWQMAAQAVGIDTSQYPTAASAPPAYQDAAALWLLQTYGPNATITWAASAPAGGYATDSSIVSASTSSDGSPIIDISGAAAATPTADILAQLENAASNVGIDLTDPLTEVAIAAIVGGVAYLALMA